MTAASRLLSGNRFKELFVRAAPQGLSLQTARSHYRLRSASLPAGNVPHLSDLLLFRPGPAEFPLRSYEESRGLRVDEELRYGAR